MSVAVAEDAVVLRPHQLGVVADQRLRALHPEVDLTRYLVWTEGWFVFQNAPFP